MFKNLIPWGKSHDTDLVTVDPKTEVAQFRANFDKMLERIWSGDWEDAWNSGWGCEIQDGESEIIVRTEAPGFEPDEFDVQLSGNRLVVQAEHKTESKKGNGTSSRYGKLYRAMTVPSGIDAGKIEANYRNGVLEVHLPKGEESRSKRIAVATH